MYIATFFECLHCIFINNVIARCFSSTRSGFLLAPSHIHDTPEQKSKRFISRYEIIYFLNAMGLNQTAYILVFLLQTLQAYLTFYTCIFKFLFIFTLISFHCMTRSINWEIRDNCEGIITDYNKIITLVGFVTQYFKLTH